MKLSVRNAKDHTLISLFKKATKFYASILLDYKIIDNLDIVIVIDSNVNNASYCTSKNSNNFYIEISRFRKKTTMLRVLAHEMVHVKQYAKKELVEVDNNTYWNGKKIDKISYWDQPWEIEAYGLENGLLAKFIHKFDLYKLLRERKSDWYMD